MRRVIETRETAEVGRCIYCGTTDAELSDEHVTPFGLSGRLVLLRASCTRCAVITSGIEATVLRSMRAARAALRTQTRRWKKRKEPQPMLVEKDGKRITIQAPLLDQWKVIRLPIFPLPAAIDGCPYESGIESRSMDQFELSERAEEVAKRHNVDNVLFPDYPSETFARVIAKMAYGYAVERYTLNAFERVYVVPAILGEANDIGRLKTNYEPRDKWNVRVRSHVKALKAGIGHRRAFELTRKHVEGYVVERQKEGKANATVNNELQLLSQAFTLTEGVGQCPKFSRLRENVREGFFEKSEVEALVKELPDFLKDFTRFGFLTGLRKGEISSLRWAELDMEGRTLRLRGTESKNGKARHIALVGELWDLIQRRWSARVCKCPDGTTFLSPLVFHRPARRGRGFGDKLYEGQPIKDFDKAWKTACGKAKLTGNRLFHDLRRSSATNMRRAGVPEQIAMQIIGHKTPSMFRRYSIGNDKDIEEAVTMTLGYLDKIPAEKQNVLEFPKANGEQQK